MNISHEIYDSFINETIEGQICDVVCQIEAAISFTNTLNDSAFKKETIDRLSKAHEILCARSEAGVTNEN